jgi:hypothetical protein
MPAGVGYAKPKQVKRLKGGVKKYKKGKKS